MEMKTLVALFSIVTTAFVFADGVTPTTTVDGGNMLGVLRVDSGAKRTLVAVPWLEPSTGVADIHITNVIKTANLKTGDRVCYYEVASRGFKLWELQANKTWLAAQSVGDVSVSDSETLKRGNAFILLRDNPESCFYLFGQVATNAAETVTMAQAENGAFNLLAAPMATDFDPNGAEWTNVNDRDLIIIELGGGLQVLCRWRGENGATTGTKAWRYQKTVDETINFGGTQMTVSNLVWADAPSIAAGQGFWYVAHGSGSALQSVRWVKAND